LITVKKSIAFRTLRETKIEICNLYKGKENKTAREACIKMAERCKEKLKEAIEIAKNSPKKKHSGPPRPVHPNFAKYIRRKQGGSDHDNDFGF